MRIVAVTDLHGRAGKAREFVEELKGFDFDLLLIGGDITHFGGREQAERLLTILEELGKPILAVMGNCDGRDVLELFEEKGINIHDKRVEFKGLGIVGFGGSNITPFSTIWEFDDGHIRDSVERNYREGDILLIHAPPYGTKVDKTYTGVHVGSKALKHFIEEKQPPLVICGHIHEARGVDEIGKTLIVNPGPLSRGHYAIIDVGDRISIELR
ncbi:hypothetical protein PAP_07740 [Palaeococcus pacificus DY20341]|uniref:Calcineurin-like phosphoesterase domain-containing protein n=1 Tax=Palaeococcus pacificus DY20341 TaxID=1343739 RepID=A0A075LVA9_9EURY|nr:metallophosphoesterase [Palaeococcus pacificus]AIF69937.1 hypothetical protein PAP_07740 [Palaeococcus pacificus DY20341]